MSDTPSDAIKAAQERITTADLEATGKTVTVTAIEEAVHDIADSGLRARARDVRRKLEDAFQGVPIGDIMREVEVNGSHYCIDRIIEDMPEIVFEACKQRVRKQAVRDFVKQVSTPPKE